MQYKTPARLETRCGCTKDIIVAFPPPPQYFVALVPKLNWNLSKAKLDEPVKIENREFEFVDWEEIGYDLRIAIYKEKV